MYAVVEYSDCSKEQFFKVIITTDDVEYAKKVVFQTAKKDLLKDTDDDIYTPLKISIRTADETDKILIERHRRSIQVLSVMTLENCNGTKSHYNSSRV